DEVAPPYQLIDEQGREFALSDLRGKAVVLDFIFTRCAGPCPILTSSHVTLQRSLPREVATRTHFVSISVDPEHDTPSDLRRYAKERGADLGSWSFLTGDATTVHDVLKRYYVGTTPADGNLVHTVATYLITPNGHIASLYMGLEHDPAHLLQDLKQLLKD
ncbi:MAG: SCO family protein, partial [Myxococcota bacterium]